MKDPVAPYCISKLVQNAADNAVVNTSQSDVQDCDGNRETVQASAMLAEVKFEFSLFQPSFCC